ncbi:MAG TPA: RodZ domain-containing protein [Thermoanaerobaculia bacterium]
MTAFSGLTFGEELRRERVVRDISLEEISIATKISVRLLGALEHSDVTRLPAPAFTRGFIRAYANHLGIDAEEKVNAYLADLAAMKSDTEAPGAVKRPRPRSRFWRGRKTAGSIVVCVSAILLLSGLIARPQRRPRAEVRRVTAAVEPVSFRNVTVSNEPAPPIRTEPPPSTAAPVERVVLLLECDSDSWTEIEADGETVFSGLLRRGERRAFESKRGFRLTLGNAGGVRVTVDGRALEKLGPVGGVLRDFPLPASPARG